MKNKKTTGKMPLTYDDALVGVFLRKLAWEINVAKGTPSVDDIVKKYVQSAREDLGLKKTTKGAPHAFIHALRKLNPKLLDKIQPHETGWKDEWRLHNLPSHRIVRTLSANPVYQTKVSDYPTKKKPQGVVQFSVSLRSPAMPKLLVTVCSFKFEVRQNMMLTSNNLQRKRHFCFDANPYPTGRRGLRRNRNVWRATSSELSHFELESTVGNSRPKSSEWKGIYFLGEAKSLEAESLEVESLYVGQTEEFQVRWDNHVNSSGRHIIWWVFIAPEEKNDDFGALDAAESLLISFWTEICVTTNKKRGKDKQPSVFRLQQAILFVEAASAAFLWLLRDKKSEIKFDNFKLPFKPCKAHHWPECYLQPSNDS